MLDRTHLGEDAAPQRRPHSKGNRRWHRHARHLSPYAVERLESRVLLSVPAGWVDLDIGGPSKAGSTTFSSTTGAWSVSGSGADIWNTSDQFHFAGTSYSGNGSAVVKVNSVGNTDPWAKSGLMFRDSSAAGAMFAAVFETGSNGICYEWRSSTNGSCSIATVSVSGPVWFQLIRSGNLFIAQYSTNGTSWSMLGGVQMISMSSSALLGLAVTSHNNSYLNISTFSNFAMPSGSPSIVTGASSNPNPSSVLATSLSVLGSDSGGESNLIYTWAPNGSVPATVTFSANTSHAARSVTAGYLQPGTYPLMATAVNSSGLSATSFVTVTINAGAVPVGWSHQDIGGPGVAGSVSYNAGSWTIKGGGSDIWNNYDQFHYAWESATGDTVVIARVTSLDYTDGWAKAGVMFRTSTDPSAAFVDLVETPANGISLQWRSTGGGYCGYADSPNLVAPKWVELVRAGNTFWAFYAADDMIWHQVGTPQTIVMPTTALAGLAVTSHNNGTSAAATFSNVSITANQAPTVATPATANPASFVGYSTVLSALGADDAGEANLTYTWSVLSGPAAVTFSDNGDHSAGSTTATFTTTGSYSLRVTISDVNGLGITSDVTVNAQVPPPAPAGIQPAWLGSNVNITWLAATGAQTYNVYRATSPNGEGSTPIAAAITGTSYTDSAVTPGQTYYYQVTGVSAASLESNRSFEAIAMAASPTSVIISELQASNKSTLTDAAGGQPDWIELFNPTTSTVDLTGYYLTDKKSDLSLWEMPSVSLAPNAFLIVYCDGSSQAKVGQELHANFSLSSDGEYLALVASDGSTVLSSYDFPQQLADGAYGIGFVQAAGASGTITSYGATGYLKPTPGAPNGQIIAQGITAKPIFDHAGGFCTGSFRLAISDSTPGASIYYTIDGSLPSATNGTLYTGPLTISGETNVRALAIAPNCFTSFANSVSFIYTAQVVTQSADGQPPSGWPSSWGLSTVHYGMDQRVVNDPAYSSEIQQDLLSLPTVSITMNLGDLFDPATGIYYNSNQSGAAWERPASIEWINPDGSAGFQIDAGLRIKGNYSALSPNPKHGFRVVFDSSYGATSLDYPLFGKGAAQSFSEFDLRTDQNQSWQFSNPGQFIGIRDEFTNASLAALGQPYTHDRICFLYINGQFWGLFDAIERPTAEFAASYYGGTDTDYDVVKSAGADGGYVCEASDGTLDVWNQLYTQMSTLDMTSNANYQLIQGNNADGTPNASNPKLLDVDNLIQYMILNDYIGNLDAPNSWFLSNVNPNNFYAIRPHDGRFGFRFLTWDSEWTLLDPNENRVNTYTSPSQQTCNPRYFFQQLEVNAAFRLRVADAIQKDFYNGGPLSPAASLARFQTLATEVYGGVALESARWGDVLSPSQPYTRNIDWQAEINRIETSYFPQRGNTVVGQYQAVNLWPSVLAPTYSQYGGAISVGGSLTIANPNTGGAIYYTLDGSDPATLNGTLSSTAILYTGPVVINQTTEVIARVFSNSTFSPAEDRIFDVPVTALRVTELNYDPIKPAKGSPYNNDDFEFIEFKNYGTTAISLAGITFTDGIVFTFDNVSLGRGQVGVVVKNPAAFASRYGTGIAVLGDYFASGTNFSNSGEHVGIVDATGQTIADFTYSSLWYPTTVGKGATLDVNNPVSNPDLNLAASWRASTAANGTPGVVDDIPPIVSAAIVNDNAAQRSMVKKLSVTFGESVSLSAGAFSLLTRSGAVVPNVTINTANTSGDQKTWDITFTVGSVAGASLPDGTYKLLVTAADVHDLAGNPLSADYRLRFYRLFGDYNGDRVVDRTDQVAMRQSLNNPANYANYFDYDGDGSITLADYSQLRRRMSKRLL